LVHTNPRDVGIIHKLYLIRPKQVRT